MSPTALSPTAFVAVLCWIAYSAWLLYWGIVALCRPDHLQEGLLVYWMINRVTRSVLEDQESESPLTMKQKHVWGVILVVMGLLSLIASVVMAVSALRDAYLLQMSIHYGR